MKKVMHLTLTATIYCKTGLRIGGSDDLLQIGGTDLTCIKHPVTLQPYLPGSSLKGKLRSELEKREGKFSGREGNEPCGCAREDCLICRIFGPHKKNKHDLGPTRIIVRDAPPLGDVRLETKTENIIDRRVGNALHPRKVERVAAGGQFGLSIGVQVWDMDEHCAYDGKRGGLALLRFVSDGLGLVQQTGIGSGVSKGYGHVSFEDMKVDMLNEASLPLTMDDSVRQALNA